MSLIRVHTFKNDSDLDCHWSSSLEVGTRVISASIAGLRNWSRELRKQLSLFVNDFKDQNKIDIKNGVGIGLSREHLKKLAQLGNKLYQVLCSDMKGPMTPELMRVWLDHTRKEMLTKGDSCHINFMVPDRVHIPWGLVYDADPDSLNIDDTTPPQIDEYGDFWGIKFNTSSVHSTIRARINPDRLPGETFYLLPAINEMAYTKAYSVLSTVERSFADIFWLETNQPLSSGHQLKEAWKKLSNENGILYFYCHADGSTIELSDTESLSAEELLIVLLRKRSPSVNLAFFNGCATATGPDRQSGEERGFMEIMNQLGFRGYIGTEAKIPDVFALRFGFDFLFYFLHGNGCLLDAMNHLRRKHWPLSLLYTINCDPLVALSRMSVPVFPDKLSDENFSLDRVGSNLLQLNAKAL